MTVIVLTLLAGLILGYVIGQTAGHWSQQSRYEEGWRDGMMHSTYGYDLGTDSDEDNQRRTP